MGECHNKIVYLKSTVYWDQECMTAWRGENGHFLMSANLLDKIAANAPKNK